MDEKKFLEHCNALFRAREYDSAKNCHIEKIDKIDQCVDADHRDKARLICYARILDCLWEQQRSADIQTPLSAFFDEFNKYYQKYVVLLDTVNASEIAPDVILRIFGYILYELLIHLQMPGYSQSDIEEKMKRSYERLYYGGKGKVSEKELYDKWLAVIEDVRREVWRSNLMASIKTLANALIAQIDNNPECAQLRCAVYNLLADAVYFFPESEKDSETTYREVDKYLHLALQNVPNDIFAITMRKNLRLLVTTQLQIRGFMHDVNSRLGRLNACLENTMKQADERLLPNLKQINTEIEVLYSLAQLTTIKGEKIGTPNSKRARECYMADVIQDAMAGYGETRLGNIQILGTPAPWYCWPGFVQITLENLLRNSHDAYERRKIPLPSPPYVFTIDYNKRLVFYQDFAGGIKIAGDIFAPYVSEKGVYSNRGLGLTQAKNAMNVQEYDLRLAEDQPEGGAFFVLDFNRQRRD